MRFPITPLFLSLAVTLVPAFASSRTPVPDVAFRVPASEMRGDSARVHVRVVVPKGWHIQSNAPLDEFLIPTEIKAAGEGVRFGAPAFPKPLLKDFPALGGDVALFQDTVDVALTARPAKAGAAAKSAKAFAAALEKSTITLRYQACNDSQCLPPKTVTARYRP